MKTYKNDYYIIEIHEFFVIKYVREMEDFVNKLLY